jgi:hypothetical protein
MYEEAFFHESINKDFSAYSAFSAFRIFLVAVNAAMGRVTPYVPNRPAAKRRSASVCFYSS